MAGAWYLEPNTWYLEAGTRYLAPSCCCCCCCCCSTGEKPRPWTPREVSVVTAALLHWPLSWHQAQLKGLRGAKARGSQHSRHHRSSTPGARPLHQDSRIVSLEVLGIGDVPLRCLTCTCTFHFIILLYNLPRAPECRLCHIQIIHQLNATSKSYINLIAAA